jgi:hypothetical protein
VHTIRQAGIEKEAMLPQTALGQDCASSLTTQLIQTRPLPLETCF